MQGYHPSGPGAATILREDNQQRLTSVASLPHHHVYNAGETQHQFPVTGGAAYSTGTSFQNERIFHGDMQVLEEVVVEHTITTPIEKTYEEVIEKVIRVPEVVKRTEIVEETKVVREKVIKLAKPVIKHKYVDVIDYEHREKVIEYPVEHVEEKLKFVEVVRPHEVIIRQPRIIETEKIVEFDDIEYRTVEVPRVVYVPELQVVEKIIERPVDRYEEVPIPVVKEVEVIQEITRQIPVAMEHTVHTTWALPQLEAEIEEVPYPIFAPCYTEVPVPAEYLTDQTVLEAEQLRQQVAMMTAHAIPSLCVAEELADKARKFQMKMVTDPNVLNKRLTDRVGNLQGQPAFDSRHDLGIMNDKF